jgi:hypothetical protein
MATWLRNRPGKGGGETGPAMTGGTGEGILRQNENCRKRGSAGGPSRRHAPISSLAITSRWISLVPSPIVVSFTSRKYFSAG